MSKRKKYGAPEASVSPAMPPDFGEIEPPVSPAKPPEYGNPVMKYEPAHYFGTEGNNHFIINGIDTQNGYSYPSAAEWGHMITPHGVSNMRAYGEHLYPSQLKRFIDRPLVLPGPEQFQAFKALGMM